MTKPSVLPGAVVRGLVARYEQEIEALTLELEAALAEAAEAERSAGGYSIADVLALGLDAPPSGGPDDEAGAPFAPPATTGPGPVTPPRTTVATPPRTTVVTRPGKHPLDAPAPDGLPPTSPAPAPSATEEPGRPHLAQDSWSSRFRAHWMMKAGVITALVGILLLKFG